MSFEPKDLAAVDEVFARFYSLTGDPLAASNLVLAATQIDAKQPTPEPVEADAPMTPAQVGKRLKASPASVIAWIRSGQLRASNLAKGPRPRYVIQPESLAAFLKMRQPEPSRIGRPRRAS